MECDRVHCCIVTVAENRGMRVGGGVGVERSRARERGEGDGNGQNSGG